MSSRGTPYLCCTFGDWRTGEKYTFKSWTEGNGIDRGELEELNRVREEQARRAEAERKARQAEAADQAQQFTRPAPADHPYLQEKGVKPHDARTDDRENLVIILRNPDGAVVGAQIINPTGDKWFLKGTPARGNFHVIGALDGAELIVVAEGFATGATVHEATGHTVVVALNCGNLGPVGRAIRKRFPSAEIIFAADNDTRTEGNPGLTKATEAAKAVGGRVAIPSRSGDFNDLHAVCGLEAVREAVEAAREVNATPWPDPKPIQAPLRGVPPFDAEVLLPEALRDYVADEADRMPCAPDYIAAAILVALGALIGARCAIKPKTRDDWTVVPNLWGAIVGSPSSKKSPATTAGMRPLDRLAAKSREAHESRSAQYERDMLVHEAHVESVKKRVKDAAKKPGEADPKKIAEELVGLSEPEKPVKRRYKSNDSTIEKLGEILRDNPVGVLMLRDELVGLIQSWEKQGHEGDRAFYLEAWNGHSGFDTDRIGRGEIYIENLCVSIFGGIQPDRLTAYLEQVERTLANDGLFQRFQILVYPDTLSWGWRDRRPNKDASNRVYELFQDLDDFDPTAFGADPANDFNKFPCFRFGSEAQRVFIEWSKDLHCNRLPAEDHPIVEQHLAKYDSLFPSLALIFHLVDCAANKRLGPVKKDAALLAAAWCEYLEAHARRCYGLLADDGLRSAQALASKLRKGKMEDNFTARDVRRHQWRYLVSGDAVQAALDWLEDEGWLRSKDIDGGARGGRPTRQYSINPRVLEAGSNG